MEKLSQIKSKFFKFLSKQPVTLVTLQNPTLSPYRSPTRVVSIIPKEARRNHKGGSFSAREPTSPKVSCMGQVQQCKKKRKAQKHNKRVQQPPMKNNDSEKKIMLWISKGSEKGRKRGGKALVLEDKASTTMIAPSLNTMKKFASGRGTLYDFDATLAER